MSDDKEIVPINPAVNTGLAIIPRSVSDAKEVAGILARSGIFGVEDPAKAFAVMLTGMEMGLSPAQSLRGIHLIKGKPSPSADALVAVCMKRADLCKYFQCVEESADSVTYETHRVGFPKPSRKTFSMKDAEKAGLLSNGMWAKYGQTMLHHRAAAALARQVYPDLCLGLYTPSEAEEIALNKEASSRPAVVSVIQHAQHAQQVQQVQSEQAAPVEATFEPDDPDEGLIKALRECGDTETLKGLYSKIRLLNLPEGSDRRNRLGQAFMEARTRLTGGQ
jgi:hypothetical protein